MIFFFKKEFKDRSEGELRDFVCNTDIELGTLKRHALATYELYKLGGLDWMIRENYRVRNHLECIMKEAGTHQDW